MRKTGNIDLKSLSATNDRKKLVILRNILGTPLAYEWTYEYILYRFGPANQMQIEKEKSYIEGENPDYNEEMIKKLAHDFFPKN